MTDTSASDLERVENELISIARTYTAASTALDQQVIRAEGAVAYVLSAGPQGGWKGLSRDAFVNAWLERKARMQQASSLMTQASGYLNQLARTIEDNVP